ncbi:Gfo/Idh/MocA family oxidoreductase [uncultured Paraglaciecola sp.]|uniref:Gfo/Idh/MocA family protein n=1 Tax=uncultured Paraglaciecola sp. TaxID=1765024 RepID=UPI00260C7330|nr:Gfo/Idh/MocA family oxidoreductase [uncultured Paraglaciecola sp.]
MLDLCVLVCGAGSIGQRHITNLKALGVRVIAWRTRKDKISELAEKLKIPVFADLNKALDACDAVIIATETHRHVDIAQKAADKKKHLFIEKPISHNLQNLEKLYQISSTNKLVIEVGCMLRMSSTLSQLKEFIDTQKYGSVLTYRAVMGQSLDTWRPGSDYRTSYSADSSRGGGALMDLIHQIDLVQYLFGQIASVYCFNQTIGPLEINAETLSSLTLQSKNGVSGQVQVDMISPIYRGNIEVVTTDALLMWDIQTNVLSIDKTGIDKIVISPGSEFQRNDFFLSHMRHFISRIHDKNKPEVVSFQDGVSALNVALTAYKSNQEGRRLPISFIKW